MIQIIAFLIGSLLAVVICEFFKAKIEQRNCEFNIAKRLSKDGKPNEYKGGYIIYANGTRWFVMLWVTWELYWIPGLHGDDLELEELVILKAERLLLILVHKWIIQEVKILNGQMGK